MIPLGWSRRSDYTSTMAFFRSIFLNSMLIMCMAGQLFAPLHVFIGSAVPGMALCLEGNPNCCPTEFEAADECESIESCCDTRLFVSSNSPLRDESPDGRFAGDSPTHPDGESSKCPCCFSAAPVLVAVPGVTANDTFILVEDLPLPARQQSHPNLSVVPLLRPPIA